MEMEAETLASKERTDPIVPAENGTVANNTEPSEHGQGLHALESQKKVRRRKKKEKEGPKFPHTGNSNVRYLFKESIVKRVWTM